MAFINYIEKHTKTFNVKRHKHKFWEIILVTDGQGVLDFFNGLNLEYKKGQIICIPPEVEHINHSQNGFKNLHLTIEDFSPPILVPTIIKENELTKDLYNLLELSLKYFHRFDSNHPLNLSLSNSVAELLNHLLNQSSTNNTVRIIFEGIENDFTNCQFDLDELYAKIPLAKEYVRKLFIKEYGVTPLQFLQAKRIEHAKQLLSRKKDINLRVNEIALSCGFLDQAYFSRLFKKHTGTTPNEFHLTALKNNKVY